MADYTFQPLTRADLPMFKDWLDNPHLDGWWGDSETEARLVEEDLGKDAVDMRIVGLSQLRRTYPAVLTDPDPANSRAIAAYARAGFRPLEIRPCEDGDPVQVMIHP